MPTNPSDYLKEIRDSLQNMPERLATVLNRKGAERKVEAGKLAKKGSKPTEDKLPDKWRATENFLGSAGNFAPGLGKAGAMMRNMRELGESWEQLQRSWGKPAKLTKPPASTSAETLPQPGPRPLPQAVKESDDPSIGAKALPLEWEKLGRLLPPPVQRSPKGHPDNIGQQMNELKQALEENTQALKGSDADPTEDAEEKQTKPLEPPKGETEIPYTKYVTPPKIQTRKIKGPFRPPKNVPSAKDAEAGGAEAAEAAEAAAIVV